MPQLQAYCAVTRSIVHPTLVTPCCSLSMMELVTSGSFAVLCRFLYLPVLHGAEASKEGSFTFRAYPLSDGKDFDNFWHPDKDEILRLVSAPEILCVGSVGSSTVTQPLCFHHLCGGH